MTTTLLLLLYAFPCPRPRNTESCLFRVFFGRWKELVGYRPFAGPICKPDYSALCREGVFHFASFMAMARWKWSISDALVADDSGKPTTASSG
ncbi:MAG: hypothetical protein IPJ00_22570 [Saprospirales bacterium]|nr:hypothetical protein [Saprospirales bacterium]